MNELIRQRGFRIGAVAEAIGINRVTIGAWTDNAPIGKLVRLSKFTGISMEEIINCLVQDDPIDTDPHQIDQTGGDSN